MYERTCTYLGCIIMTNREKTGGRGAMNALNVKEKIVVRAKHARTCLNLGEVDARNNAVNIENAVC